MILSNGTIVRGNQQPWNLAVPLGIAYDPSNQSVWLSGAYSGTLARYDADTGTRWAGASLGTAATYPTGYGGAATDVAVLSNINEIAVASPSESSVVLANGVTGALMNTLFLANHSVPSALAYDPQQTWLFVADQRLGEVWVLNLSSDSVQTSVPVGAQPSALWFDGSTNDLYVANFGSSNVTVINATSLTIRAWVHVGAGPIGFAQVGTRVWVLNQVSENVSWIGEATRTVGGSWSFSATGPTANGLVYDSGRNVVGVLNAPAGDLQLLNASTGAAATTIVVGGTPYRGAYDPSRGEIDLTNTARNTLDAVNDGSNALARSTVLGSAPMASFFDATTQYVYVADASVSWLDVLDARTNAIVSTIPLASPGIDLAFAASVNTLAVVMANGGVSFINPGSGQVQGTWKLSNGTLLLHVAYGNGEFFFTGGLPFGLVPFNDVFVVGASGFTELTAIGGGAYNSGITYDPVNHYVYVATNTSLVVISSVSDNRINSYPIAGALGLVGAAFSQRSNAVVLTDWLAGQIHVFNISVSAEDIPPATVLVHPGPVSYVPDSNTFYIPLTGANQTFTLVDLGGGSYLTGTIDGGEGPNGYGYSQLSGLLYISNAAGGTISFLQVGSSASLPMVVTLAISPTTVAIGSSIQVSAVATYPMWDDAFSYSGLPTGCPSRNSSSFACTPNETGSFQATVSVTNPFGAGASQSARFAVFAPLTVVAFSAVPQEFTLGLSTQITVTLAGGVQPLTVGYPLRPTGCAATNATNWSCRPTAAGTFPLEVTVSDSGGHSISQNLSLIVNPHLSISSFFASVNSTSTGKTVVFSVVIAGGTGPYTFAYTGLPGGCASANTSLLTCVPTSSGVFPVLVRVTDADGVSATSNTSIVVSGTGTSGSGGGLSTTDLLILLAVVVVIAVAAIAVVAMRRRSGSPPPPRPPAPLTPAAPESAEEAPAESAAEAEGVTIVEAPPPEPILPPSPPPAPVPEPEIPSAPRYYSDPNAPAAPAARSAPRPPGEGRPALVCSHCGTANEPWLNNCRKCKRALLSTGTA